MLNLILIVKMLQSIKPFFNFTNRTFLKEKWRNDSLRIWVFVVRIIVLGSVGVFCSNATTNLAIAPRRLRESFLLHIVMNTYLPTHIFLEKSPPHLTLETSNLLSLFSLRFLRWWSCWLCLSYKHHHPPPPMQSFDGKTSLFRQSSFCSSLFKCQVVNFGRRFVWLACLRFEFFYLYLCRFWQWLYTATVFLFVFNFLTSFWRV